MDIHQLKTFVAVAREGSVTRASERIHLSQPAVSAHIKALEDELGLALFVRTARGMTLTTEGERLFARAEQTLTSHRDLIDEAARLKNRLSGRIRLGTASNSNPEALGRVLTALAERCPEVEVSLRHGTSLDLLNGIRSGSLDAGFYNEAGVPDPELTTVDVGRFDIYLAAPPKTIERGRPVDWQKLAEFPWIGPTSGSCCGQAAENLFERHRFRPRRTTEVDRESVTRTLIAGGLGVGLLHEDSAKEAERSGEVELLGVAQASVRVLFTHLASRSQEPLLHTVRSVVERT